MVRFLPQMFGMYLQVYTNKSPFLTSSHERKHNQYISNQSSLPPKLAAVVQITGKLWEDREDLDYGFLDFSPFILRPYLQLLGFTVGINLVINDKVL